MRPTLMIVPVALALASTFPTAATADQTRAEGIACGDHATLVAALTERYEERRVSLGLQNDGRLFELFASDDSGTWTVLSTRTDGTSCILAVGRHFEQRDLPPVSDPKSDGATVRAQPTAG